MQLIYFMSESLAPEKFARILNPADARYELERHYLFGGSSMSSDIEQAHYRAQYAVRYWRIELPGR